MIRTVCILANPKIPGVEKAQEEIRLLLEKSQKVVEKQPSENTDLLVTLGGDGTLLKGVHSTRSERTLVFGIKFGQVGFLTNPAQNLKERLARILAGQYRLSERMLLRAELKRNDRVLQQGACLNEVILSRVGIRIVDIAVKREVEELMRVRADGLMVATPTGSTAHSLAAGGPVILPETEAWLLLALCPYAKFVRPLVCPPDKRLEVTASAECRVVLDGQQEMAMGPADCLSLSKDTRKARLIFEEEAGFFGKLKEKFGWPL